MLAVQSSAPADRWSASAAAPRCSMREFKEVRIDLVDESDDIRRCFSEEKLQEPMMKTGRAIERSAIVSNLSGFEHAPTASGP